MRLTYEIKAKSKEEAIRQVKEDYKLENCEIVKVKENVKPSTFLKFFKTDGSYTILVDDLEEGDELDIDELDSLDNFEDPEEKAAERKAAREKLHNLVLKEAKELLTLMGIDLDIEIKEGRDHYVLLNLSGPDNGIIIGKKGKSLNSFEYLLNTFCRSIKVEVDVEGFKEKRAETLRDLGRKMAEKVIATGKTVRLNSMPSRERKIIHEIVGKYKELDTFSEGRDPKRYIVIKRKRGKEDV